MIDSYCHCGLSKYLPVEDVDDVMGRMGVEQAVLVQHLGEFDNTYLESVVADRPWRFRAVGLVDGERSDWRDAVEALAAGDAFAGLRIPHNTLDRNPELCVLASELGLVLVIDAALGVRTSLPALERLVARASGPIVMSHLGYPQVRDGRMVEGRDLLRLARDGVVYVLLSGQSEGCAFPYEELRDFTVEVVDTFGVDRILWGSNFPVCGGEDGFRRDFSLVDSGAWGLGSSERDLVTAGNARKVWFCWASDDQKSAASG